MSYSPQASSLAFDYITHKISTGQWVPGMKIDTEEQLCNNLNVSRIAVRQAIEKLSALSVLRKVQGSGTYVNSFEDASLLGLIYYPPTRQTMLTVLEFRRMFDSYNAELFVKNAQPEEREALDVNYRDMVKLRDVPEKFQVYESAFHHMIAVGTHNAVIQQISSMLTELLVWQQKLQYSNIGPDNSIEWHGKILDAIQSGNGELASLCTRIHIDNSIAYLKSKIEDALAL